MATTAITARDSASSPVREKVRPAGLLGLWVAKYGQHSYTLFNYSILYCFQQENKRKNYLK
jgi:hypothetical protein